MSMNHLCACTGVSASKLELPKQREISNSCKICGGKPLVDGQGALPTSMLGNIGLEIAGAIDPHLNWKTASKGKPRAVRRARTSFTSIIRRKPVVKAPEDNEDLISKESKRLREMPVSESEKLGVTILGQRFGDAIESVPIKKRRFLFRSPSPPPHLSFTGQEPGHTLVSGVTSQSGNAPVSNSRRHLLKINNVYKTRLNGDRGIADEKSNLNDIEEEKLCGGADFSGISILAAAACNSSSAEDDINTESLDSKQCSFRRDGSSGISESQSGAENKIIRGQVLDIVPILGEKVEAAFDNPTKMSCSGEDTSKVGRSSLEKDPSGSSSTVPSKDDGSFVRKVSLRDDRLHWDLNTVMEAWESPDDGIMDSQPVASGAVGEDGIHGARVDKQETFENIMEDCATSVGRMMDKKVEFGSCESENVLKSDSPCNDLPPDHGDCSIQEHQLGCTPVQRTDSVEEIDVSNNQEPNGFTKDAECSRGHHPDPLGNSPSANGFTSEEEKPETKSLGADSTMKTEAGGNLHPNDSATAEQLVCGSVPYSDVGVPSNEVVYGKQTLVGSEVDLCKRSDDCGPADIRISELMQAGESVSFQPDQDASRPDDHYIAERVSDILVDGDLRKTVAGGETHGATGETVTLAEENAAEENSDIMQSAEARKGSSTSESSAFVSCGLSNCEEMPGECMNKNEWEISEKARLQGSSTMVTDQDRDSMELDHLVHIVPKDSMTPDIGDECLLADTPNDADKCYKGGLVNSPVENALDDHFDCDYSSDISPNEQAMAMEKVEQQGDDESQYEDGEFRESFVHRWEMDGGDEGEAEHVDYGSDNREGDGFEAASDDAAFNMLPQVGSTECKNGDLLEDSHADEDLNVEELKAESRNFLSSVAKVSDIGTPNKRPATAMNKGQNTGHSKRKHMYKNWEKSTKDAAESGAVTDKVVDDEKELVSEGDSRRERSHSTSLRVKLSGWDRLPGSHRNSGDAVTNSVVESSIVNCDGVPEKLRTVGSTLRKELSSQIGRSKSPNIVHRKGRACFRGSRKRDHSNDIHRNVKRDDVELGRSARRDDSSVHIHCRGRGDHWMEPSSHQRPTHHDSPGYYSRAGFTHAGSKNAAAVSIAKVESNGFVVAPDGTVLEASGVGPSGRLPRRAANSSPNARSTIRRRVSPIERDETLSFQRQLDLGSRRELSPGRPIAIGHGRPGRYGAKMVSEGSIERYHGFTADDNIGDSLPVHHSFSRRQRSFSPQTRPVQVSRSHTRSRSRSRSRSPHTWTSPRRGNLMNNGLRRRTRSPPDFRSEARVGRVRSPRGRSGFAERMANFVPSPRNRSSPLRASRWIDERKDVVEHFRDNEYRRFSGRSPPKRLFSRSHKFNPVASSGRLKPDGFYRPIQSGRFSEFHVGRGPRPDDGDGDRRHVDQYEMLPSARQYDILGDVKRLRYENEDGFRLHNDRSKNAPEFPERGSPRSFDRGAASQISNSPQRAKEEMSHFRYGRDGKHKTSYKTYELRECDDNETPQRGRHS